MTTSQRIFSLRPVTPLFSRRLPRLFTLAMLLVAATAILPAQTPPSAPQAKPLIILRPDGGKAIALRARTVTLGANLLVETLDGKAQTLPITTYVNQLPWYTDAELESGRVDLGALAVRYRAFGGLYPDAQPTLYAEAQKFRDIAERLKNAGEQRTAQTQKRAADYLAFHFDPEKIGTRDEIADFVREGDELTHLLPAQAAPLSQAAAPYRDALARLDSGQVYYDGRWQPAAEAQSLRQQRADAAIQQTFGATLALPLEPLALTTGQLVQALVLPVLALLGLLIVGLALLLGKRRALGVLLLAVALAGGGLGYALLTQNNAGSLVIPPADAPETQASAARLVRLLYQASLKDPALLPAADRNVRLTNADLSSFLARYVQPKEGSEGGGLHRDGLAVGILSDGFALVERVVVAGQTAYLRYEVKLDAAGTVPGIKDVTVKAGGIPLPDPVKGWLWARLGPALDDYLGNRHILDVYALTDMTRGEIDLAATPPLRATSPSAPVPEPTAAIPLPADPGTFKNVGRSFSSVFGTKFAIRTSKY